ncbi:MAG: signal peptidase II [Beijerinckiaceae bacterium]
MGRQGRGGGMKPHPRAGFITAVVTLAADQATKVWALFFSPLVEKLSIPLLPFLELVVVWNRGISYGMFQQSTDLGRWLLVALSVAAALGFTVWLARAQNRVLALSLGLLIGGAVGNLIDRVVFGAVFDFIHLHWGSFSWYVFNIADAAIVAGVAGLMYDAFAGKDGKTAA